MKKKALKFLSILLLLCGCSSLTVPNNFTYKEIETRDFKIASWQKITNPKAVYKVYIEGDGYAFNSKGKPTKDPTPKGTLVRDLAFGDENPNVIYLARPCQYVKSSICSQRHWTTARFASEIVNAEYDAIKQISGNNPIILVGFSGGAQVARLVASAKLGLNVKKIITIAGNLDHLAWTQYHQLPLLNESMNLENYQEILAKIPQIHYVGADDTIIPPLLTKQFIKNDDLIVIVPNATHNGNWGAIYQKIQAEN